MLCSFTHACLCTKGLEQGWERHQVCISGTEPAPELGGSIQAEQEPALSSLRPRRTCRGFQREIAAVGSRWAPCRGTGQAGMCRRRCERRCVCVHRKEGQLAVGCCAPSEVGDLCSQHRHATSPALGEALELSVPLRPPPWPGWKGCGCGMGCGPSVWPRVAGNTRHCPGAFGHLCSWLMGVTAVGEGGEQKQGWCSEESRALGGVRQTPTPPRPSAACHRGKAVPANCFRSSPFPCCYSPLPVIVSEPARVSHLSYLQSCHDSPGQGFPLCQ